MRRSPAHSNESGQELRIRLDHALHDLTPLQRIDLGMVLMSEGAASLQQQVEGGAVRRQAARVPIATAEYMFPKQICKHIPIGERRLDRLLREGEIPYVELDDRRKLVRLDAVEQWLLQQEIRATSPG